MAKLNDTIAAYRGAADAWWNARTDQERRMLGVGGAVLALGLVWGVLIDPALSGRSALRQELPQLHQQVAELQGLAGEAARLAAQPQVAPQPPNKDSLAASLQAQGLGTQSLTVSGDYVRMEVKGVAFAALAGWLDAMRREQRLIVQEAHISAQGAPGQVDATLTLRQEGSL